MSPESAPDPAAETSDYGLVADIGGTNVRFALANLNQERPFLLSPQRYLCRDFPSAADAAKHYLAERLSLRVTKAVLAVAGPVLDGKITFTNTRWSISEVEFSQANALTATRLINDYAALALAAPLLSETDAPLIGSDVPARPGGTIAILGAGTGFGVSALVRDGFGEAVLTTEAGHMSMAPVDELETEIWRNLSARFGRLSIERLLSGPGLLNLYQALSEIRAEPAHGTTPDDVTRLARQGDPLAGLAVSRFCGMLGSVAGDLALGYGALGGVYIAGGVSARMFDNLQTGDFRARFEAKGRFEAYLKAIPTRLILEPDTAALIGAVQALKSLTT